jgi:flagellar hook-associated protein 3 FlgL
MRVTPSMQDRNFLENINRTKTRLDKAQEQITTGKRVNRFSDDPFAASQSNRIAALTSTNDQFIANNELLRGKLELTDSTLQSLIQTMDSARTAAAQALSGTTTPESRAALAESVGSARAEALSSANAKFNGLYLFAGTQSTDPPFVDSGGSVSYMGNDDPVYMRLDAATVMKTNLTNSDVFAGPPAMFDTLDALKTAIQNNDTAGIRARLGDLETLSDGLNTADTIVGGNLQLVDQVQKALKDHNNALQSESSRLTDADLVKAISDMNLANDAVSVSLRSQAQTQNLSLIDMMG